MFFALFDQSQSAWVLQAEKMNLMAGHPLAAGPGVRQLLLHHPHDPAVHLATYPALNRAFPLTPLRKIGIGMFVTAVCFVVPAWVEPDRQRLGRRALAGSSLPTCSRRRAKSRLPSLSWKFAYTPAPKKLKTFVMSLYLLAISLQRFLCPP